MAKRLDWSYEELVLACDVLARHPRGVAWHELASNHEETQELSRLLQLLPTHPIADRLPQFRSPDSVRKKMADLATAHPASPRPGKTNGGKRDKVVLHLFLTQPKRMAAEAAGLRALLSSGQLADLPPVDGEVDALEGQVVYRYHRKHERDPTLRAKKLAAVGAAACEVCGFDFAAVYGERGQGYAEVHHRVPLHASGPRRTRLDDLAVLCANCHRMIHRTTPWLTVDELIEIVRDR
ncbi:HNH endonuclease [Actinokineospora bangkokensis]|uniref:HNH endonuclease n=1 Tax=Actinokineospora bangkokensis TaxID=1193682 RepID=UPI000AA0E856|nr:HNH endonuclease [Actinokineospora bangkokensis]